MSDQPIHTEAERIAAEVRRREARRVRSLSVLTVGLWIISVFLIAVGGVAGDGEDETARDPAQAARPDRPAALGPGDCRPLGERLAGNALCRRGHARDGAADGYAASICTVALSLTIRRVTLRQITENLAQISTQIRELKSPPAA